MKLTFLIACLLCLYTVHARRGRKITFYTGTDTFNPQEVPRYNDDYEEPAVGSDEYYENLRWVAVTSDGYETEGTLEEAKAMFPSDLDEQEEPAAAHHSDEPAAAFEDSSEFEKRQAIEDEEDEDKIDNTYAEDALDAFKEVTEQKVLGTDDRRLIRRPRTRGRPYSAIGRIENGCIGTLIRNRVVLTAAYCVINGFSKSWQKNLNFYRAKDCNPNQGQLLIWQTAITYHNNRVSSGRVLEFHDIGVIILKPHNFNFRTVPMHALKTWSRRVKVYTAGYPTDKHKPGDLCQWESPGLASFTRNYKRFHHTCDTGAGVGLKGGNYGSPIWFISRRGQRLITGLNRNSPYRGWHTATRITAFHKRNIRKWIKGYE